MTNAIKTMTAALAGLLMLSFPISARATTDLEISVDGSVASFPTQFMPEPAGIVAAETVIPTNFLVNALSFTLQVTGPAPSALLLQICNGSEKWSVGLDVPASGVSTEYQVAADFSAGWTSGPDSDAARFAAALSQATRVRVFVQRSAGTASQSVQIDDLTVSGSLSEPTIPVPSVDELAGDRDGDGIPDGWELDHGLSASDADDATADDDRDTMSNLAEYRAGTDPNDGSSLLAIDFVGSGDLASGQGNLVRWQSAPGRSYTIWRAVGSPAGFEQVSGSIPSDGEQTTFEDLSVPDASACFYSIRLDG